MFGMMPGWGNQTAHSDALLLCHFDGANGSTSFTDSSTYARTVTTVGGAQLSTSQKKWGSAGLYLPDSSAGVSVAHDTGFDLSAGGTVEWWANPQDFSAGSKTHISKWGAVNGYQWSAGHDGDGKAYFHMRDSGGGFHYFEGESGVGVVVNDNTWKHFAIQASEGATFWTMQMWVNGARVVRYDTSLPIGPGFSPLRIGRNDDGLGGHLCHLDDVVFYPSAKHGNASSIPVPTGPYT
jgi:hypothetical protein